LVNNVGAFATKLFRTSVEDLRNTVVLNALPGILVTKLLIEKMYNREKRSGIIWVGSVAGKAANWYQGPYHSTKSLCSHFHIGETDNYKDKIDFLSCFPGYVATNMVSRRKVDMVTCNAEECAEPFCRLLGVVNQTYGHWKHQLFCRSLAVSKWFFGWKNNLTWAYGVLRSVQYMQYTMGLKKPRNKMTKEEKREERREIKDKIKSQYSMWHFVREKSIQAKEKVRNVGGKMIRSMSFSSVDSDVSTNSNLQSNKGGERKEKVE